MPSLDPIVSLSVAIAETPGSYAFFLGSGVSRDAGVPTGSQVFWQGAGELYRLEKETQETPEQEQLGEWLSETDRGGMTYSDLLEEIAPDPATRRDYLAKHFEGREPAPSHQKLADLAEQGLVRVFVTTNFDRLLEHALQARGIEPVVITSAAELRSAPRREHTDCYVLKPHGDYLQETIRNTPAELQKLEPAVAKEMGEVFERYGIVVLGYSGSDEAIAQSMSKRRSRYGLYWVARGDLGEGAQRILEKTGGRIIKRPGAAEFVADLQRRLEVFRTHPSGHTPIEVHDEVLALVREGDQVGLGEVMRRERREFAEGLRAAIAEHSDQTPNEENLLEAHDAMLPLWERRLGSALPLIAYAPQHFEPEVRSLVDLLEDPGVQGHYTAWRELIEWSTWWLTYATGAFALFQEQWSALEPLLTARFTTWSERQRYLATPVREDLGNQLGAVVMARLSNSNWIAPRWEHLVWSLGKTTVLQERWPEFLRGKKPSREPLCDFDFLVTIKRGIDGDSPVPYWTIGDGNAVRPARRIKNDPKYRGAIAELMGVEPEDFIATAKEALGRMRRGNEAHGGEEAIRALFPDGS